MDGFKYNGPQIKAYFLTHAHSGTLAVLCTGSACKVACAQTCQCSRALCATHTSMAAQPLTWHVCV